MKNIWTKLVETKKKYPVGCQVKLLNVSIGYDVVCVVGYFYISEEIIVLLLVDSNKWNGINADMVEKIGP